MEKTKKEKITALWAELKELTRSEEIAAKILENRDKLRRQISEIDGEKLYYRFIHGVLHFLSWTARIIDYVTGLIFDLLERIPFIGKTIRSFREWKNHLNFREGIEFIRAKIYSLTHPPHNEKAMGMIEDISAFARKHGLDLNRHIPELKKRFAVRKNHLLQHKFFQEFSKTNLERLLAIQFRFDRNIFPVLPDKALWHKIFEYLERKKVKDIILSGPGGERLSLKMSSAGDIARSTVVRMLGYLSKIKESGRRIFFIGHHEGYLGPYFVRSVVRKLGFDNLTRNCNTIVGPRMLSNLVLRNGAANVGNLFLTVPSQKTTEIKTSGLAAELRKTARRTTALIKMPYSVLAFIEKIPFEDFKKIVAYRDIDRAMTILESESQRPDIEEYMRDEETCESIEELSEEDYNLFKNIKSEPFLIFPEGSRSNIDTEGRVIMKYINPRYFQAYMRPGDYIAPVNLVGGSDLTRGWRLSPAVLGISMAEPYEVTREMIADYEEEGLRVMKIIAGLPNIKEVIFSEEVQFRQ